MLLQFSPINFIHIPTVNPVCQQLYNYHTSLIHTQILSRAFHETNQSNPPATPWTHLLIRFDQGLEILERSAQDGMLMDSKRLMRALIETYGVIEGKENEAKKISRIAVLRVWMMEMDEGVLTKLVREERVVEVEEGAEAGAEAVGEEEGSVKEAGVDEVGENEQRAEEEGVTFSTIIVRESGFADVGYPG
jgi:hypothetical protein